MSFKSVFLATTLLVLFQRPSLRQSTA